MSRLNLVLSIAALIVSAPIVTLSQEHHHHGKSMDAPMQHREKIGPSSLLQAADGASIKIISPKEGQVFKGDAVPLQFKLTKGKKGEHVHAYVDGELVGMFKGEKGTLNGLKPGPHTLEVRVATADHKTELNAVDRVKFIVK